MQRVITTSILISWVLLFTSLDVKATATNHAYALPVENIEIDGDFTDWAKESEWYSITHFAAETAPNPQDFSAQFSTAYNINEQCIYVAIKVRDDQDVLASKEDYASGDHVLLYLDAQRNIKGGSPIYFAANDQLGSINRKPGNFDTSNHSFSPQSIRIARKRNGDITQYEWKIKMPKPLQLHQQFGIDFMISDIDEKGEEEQLLLWKEGYGKSYGAHKLGGLSLISNATAMGAVAGSIQYDHQETNIKEINVISKCEKDVWMSIPLNEDGSFSAQLPVDEYCIQAVQRYTSPIGSSAFHLNTRQLEYETLPTFQIKEGKEKVLKAIKVNILPRPSVASNNELAGKRITHLSPDLMLAYLKVWQEYLQIPAVSVVVIRNREVILEEALGVKDNFEQTAVDSTTLFEAASITKAVFATMVLKLAEDGIIDLDKPLHEYLPFPNIANDERSKLLTARIILGHQSGLPNWAWWGPGSWEFGGEVQLNFEPGTAFGYSGEAFNYLGRVIEHISQKSLAQLFQENIAQPFQLRNSYFLYEDEQESRFALGHTHQYPQIKENERLASPASSLSTNASDFKRFVLGLMNEEVLQKSSYQKIYTPYTRLDSNQKVYDPTIPQFISHGFFVQEDSDGLLLAHGGNNGDYDSKFVYNPQQGYGYMIFTNSNLGDELIRAFEEYLFNRD